MISRDLAEEDMVRVDELFRKQNLECYLPPLSVFTITSAIEADGRVVMAVGARPTVELFLVIDSEWSTPGMREAALRLIHEDMNKKLLDKGYFDGHAWIPPKLAKSFGRRLMRKFKEFNWTLSTWPCFTVFMKR